jgi:hypothetical protein
MKSITLKITRTETWYPEISIPEKDQSAFNHMPDDQAEEYISKLTEENEEWIYDEMRHKYTLDTDVETETFKENMADSKFPRTIGDIPGPSDAEKKAALETCIAEGAAQ